MAEVGVMMAKATGPLPSRKVVLQALAEERVSGRVLNRSQSDRLARAAGLSVGSVEDRRQAAALVRAVQAELEQADTVEVVDAGLDATIALMRVRGEEVEDGHAVEAEFVRDRFGAPMRHQGDLVLKTTKGRRISKVDGLRSLHRSGALSDAELNIGERLRSLAEAARPPISSGQINPVRVDGGKGATSDDLVAAAISRGDSAMRLTMIMKAVSPYAGLVSAVIIEGQSLRSCGDGGNVKAANIDRIKRALGVADRLQMVRQNVRMAVLS